MEEILEQQLLMVKLLQHFLQLRNCGPQEKLSQAACCAGRVYMNWIDSHSQVDEGVTVGSYRINHLLFADDLVLLASSQQSSTCTRSVFSCVRPSQNENQH